MEGTIGEVRLFASNFAPNYWMLCNGQLLPINQFQALFSLIGNTYGGDGRTTFALPRLASPLTPEGSNFGNYIICVYGIYPARP